MSRNPYHDTYYMVGFDQYLMGAAMAGGFVAVAWWIILRLRPQVPKRLAAVTITVLVIGMILTIGPVVAFLRFASPVNEEVAFASIRIVSALGAATTALALALTAAMFLYVLLAFLLRRP